MWIDSALLPRSRAGGARSSCVPVFFPVPVRSASKLGMSKRRRSAMSAACLPHVLTRLDEVLRGLASGCDARFA